MIDTRKKRLGMHEKRRQREAGLIAALLAVAVVLYTLFATPELSVRQDGSYVVAMDALGLAELEAPGKNGIAERFAYKRYDMGALAALSAPAMAYPAALVRLITEPFGRCFDTRLLACVYALLVGLGAYLLVGGLWRHSRLAAAGSGGLLLLLCTYTPAVCYFNSLYETGAVLAFSVLYLGALVHCLCQPRARGIGTALLVLLCAVLLLRSQAQMIIFAPFAALSVALCVLHVLPTDRRRGLSLLCLGLALLGSVQGVAAGFAADETVHSDTANYLAVFQGYLPASQDVVGDLRALGLPEDYAADVGRSYYDAQESFAHNPRDEAEREGLLNRITLGKRIGFCLAHPGRVAGMLAHLSNHFYDAYNDDMVTADGQTRFVRPSPLILLDLMLPMAGAGLLEGYMLASALLCLLCVFVAPRGTGLPKLCVCLCLTLLGMACYLPFCLMVTGGTDVRMVKVVVFFFAWAGLFGAVVAGVCLGSRLCGWLSSRDAALRPVAALEEVTWRPRLSLSRGALMACCAVSCVCIGLWTLASEAHIGGIYNGDYGRMMDQLGIIWTDDLMGDYETQTSRVVEEYALREGFRPERLTCADPTYSLIFPASLVRLWDSLTGAVFSTRTIAVILFVITALCILLMVHDLYPLLGRLTIVPAVGLITMLLGENYVAWYNALFGESMLSVGLVMTLACALHLIAMERGSRKSWLWLLLLAFSVRVMACSKAQMALALPGGLALLIGLAVYHHPQGAKKLTAYVLVITVLAGLISWNTLGIYRKNEGVSAHQTVWSSAFYGALMIADDPDAAMAELGIDPAMKPDIGKHAYYPDEEYVYPLYSQEAKEGFYDHVNTLTMVRYYLRHPLDLLKMLDRAARESVRLHTGFMAYTDEVYTEHEALTRLTVWMNLRPFTACRAFWQYVVVYGAAVILCLWLLCRRGSAPLQRLLAFLFLCVMSIGVLQYPLSVVGNGFADNNKQLYGFMLCHDLLVLFAVTAAARGLWKRGIAGLKEGGKVQ